MGIKKYRDLFSSGDMSAEEITKKTLANIDEHNDKLNAFLSVLHDRAIVKAQELDQKRKEGKPLGRLAGVPIAIKDNIHILGEKTTCASKFLSNYVPPFSATVTRLLEAEDAIIVGKTNLDEFAMGGSGTHSAFSHAKNPWDLNCSPGGSSSGSSAAVAGRLCPVALGTDTGGSIRQPASLTGITGFKPTYGRVSRYGLVAFGSSFDQVGPMVQTVEEAALLMEIMGQPCERDSTSIPYAPPPFLNHLEQPFGKMRIGVPWKFLEQLQGEAKNNFDEAMNTFKQLGGEIVDVDLEILKYGIAIYYILTAAEASSNLSRFDGVRYGNRAKNPKDLDQLYRQSREEGFGWEVKNRILLGTYVLSSEQKVLYYDKAQQVRTLIIRKLQEAFSTCDVIALPSAPGTTFPLNGIKDPLDEYLQDLYTVGANLAGLPAISVPSGFSSDQKPFGLQLMGPQLHDHEVLRAAHAFQTATDHLRTPPAFKEIL